MGGFMKKQEKPVEVKELRDFYKGYDMRWLKEEKDHPDYKLVAEFEALKEIK
jgi:hypothetical protein